MKPVSFRKEIGNLGEDLAVRYLENKGFSVVERNYLRKWGEIDLIVEKQGLTHFIEVKTITHDLSEGRFHMKPGDHRPEDNVHPEKLRRMARVIQTYLLHKKIESGNWQFDVVTVLLDRKNKKAKIDVIPNVVL